MWNTFVWWRGGRGAARGQGTTHSFVTSIVVGLSVVVVVVVVAGFYGRYCAPIIKIKTMALLALDRSALHINATATATATQGRDAGGAWFWDLGSSSCFVLFGLVLFWFCTFAFLRCRRC